MNTKIKKVVCEFFASILEKTLVGVFSVSMMAYIFKKDNIGTGEALTGLGLGAFLLLICLFFKLKGEFYE